MLQTGGGQGARFARRCTPSWSIELGGICKHATAAAPQAKCQASGVDGSPHVDVKEEAFRAKWEAAAPFHTIPGDQPLPILGNMWRFIPGIGNWANKNLIELRDMWRKDFGDITMLKGVYGQPDSVNLFHVKDIETVYRNEGRSPIRELMESVRYYQTDVRKDEAHNYLGLATAQGEHWYKMRMHINRHVLPPRVFKSYLPGLESVATDFLKRVETLRTASPSSEMPATFLNELHRWSLESIGLIALDTRLGCLEPDMRQDSEAQKMITAVVALFDTIYHLDFIPSIWKQISTPTYRKFIKLMDYVTQVCLKYIIIAGEDLKKKPTNSDQPASILQELLKGDKNSAVALAMDLVIGGIDTTSKSSAAAMYFLAQNQEAQSKLREELMRILPDPETPITTELIDQMKYLRATVKESQRLAPLASTLVRNTATDLVLSGYRVPKGTRVMVAHVNLCHSDEHFPNARQFVPDRWLADAPPELSAKNASPFVYFPFGFGTRACAGKRIAFGEMELILAKIFRKYKVEWNHPEMVFEMKIFYEVRSPLRFKLTPL